MKKKISMIAMLITMVFVILSYDEFGVDGSTRLSQQNIYLQTGSTYKLKLKRSSGKIKWSSTNKKVVKVDRTGKVTAVAAGKAYIKAKNRNKIYTCKVKVVSLSRKLITLSKGQTIQIKVNNGKNSAWTSSDNLIATVDQQGNVKAKCTGKATIICKSNNVTMKCEVYVASLNKIVEHTSIDSLVALDVSNTGHSYSWSSTNAEVASVNAQGIVDVKKVGNATIICKTGDTELTCKIQAVNPNNIYTLKSSLPTSTWDDDLTVTIASYPGSKTYTIHKQNAKQNLSKKFNKYMPGHGCSASSLTCVLNAYSNYTGNPVYTVEEMEKKVFGESTWSKNYLDKNCVTSHRMPISQYGMTKVLSYYNVKHRYVRSFTDNEAIVEITNHLKTGNPVIFVVSAYDRSTNKKTNKWTTGYHCMTMLGLTETGKVIIADTVNRSKTTFGDNQRIKYATVTELVHYMFPCTNTSTSKYWSGKGGSGGYILINPQD